MNDHTVREADTWSGGGPSFIRIEASPIPAIRKVREKAQADERESIAKWLDSMAELHKEVLSGQAPRWWTDINEAEHQGRVDAYRIAAFQIRDGAHNEAHDRTEHP